MRMRSMRSVVAVATMTAAMAAFAGPAVADDGIGERLENRLENRAERVENFYDNRGFDVDIDVDDDDVYYSPLFYYGGEAYEEYLDEVYDIEVDLD